VGGVPKLVRLPKRPAQAGRSMWQPSWSVDLVGGSIKTSPDCCKKHSKSFRKTKIFSRLVEFFHVARLEIIVVFIQVRAMSSRNPKLKS